MPGTARAPVSDLTPQLQIGHTTMAVSVRSMLVCFLGSCRKRRGFWKMPERWIFQDSRRHGLAKLALG